MPVLRFGDRPYFWNPWDEFERIRQGLDDLSRGNPLARIRQGSTVFPPLNVYEDGACIVIQAELPGIKAEDLDVSVEAETLTLKGQRRHQPKNGSKISYHRREIDSGSFNRAVTLPCRVQPDAISARLHNGILTLDLPKAAEVKPRQIRIATS